VRAAAGCWVVLFRLIAVVATSLVIVRRRRRYEWWYTVHPARLWRDRALLVPRDPPTGNELVLDRVAADYWRALYIATLVVVLVWRVLVPPAAAARHRLRPGRAALGRAWQRNVP
jgi:hypothetical protein